jgi:hypothetical protein
VRRRGLAKRTTTEKKKHLKTQTKLLGKTGPTCERTIGDPCYSQMKRQLGRREFRRASESAAWSYNPREPFSSSVRFFIFMTHSSNERSVTHLAS